MNTKIITLSICTASLLFASDTNLGKIEVSANGVTKKVENISGEELKSADLAEALSKNSSSVSLLRRSGIANDIIVRGQKKDNIAIDIDGCCIAGACPNRMDPPTSHIVTNNVENVDIIGGPFDVESFGVLSAKVKIKTKDPKEGLNGEVNVNVGSFGYQKETLSVSGGDSKVRVLLSGSTETGGQYKDGDGKTLAEQLKSKAKTTTSLNPNINPNYKDQYKDMDAFSKKTGTLKLFVNPTDNSELRFGYMANRSDNVLYPSSTMDALYDNSNVLSFGATIKNISDYSKEVKLDAYKSTVKHLMSTKYRILPADQKDSYVDTDMTGIKLKNSFELGIHKIDLGIDTSNRNWYGESSHITGSAVGTNYSIPDVDTNNKALFAKMAVDLGNLNVETGARYDNTNIKANKISASTMNPYTDRDNDYKALSANVLATYKTSDTLKIFAGAGQSSRVPDGKELYGTTDSASNAGNLNQTTNREVDFGADYNTGTFGLKAKVFHSDLKDYIYYYSTSTKYVNTDAKISGIELSGYKTFTDTLSFDFGASYQKGKKDALSTDPRNDDTDMADITPLKANLALQYDDSKHKATLEMVARKSWTNIDSDNGEQKLAGWAILNTKYNHVFTKNFDLTVGMDNILNKTYAITNTYTDLSLAGTDDGVILLNEPGRYSYINARFKF